MKLCPRCGHGLQQSDVEGYEFTCLNCDEDFYGIETIDTERECIMSSYNSENSTVLAMKTVDGNNTRMLLHRECSDGRHEFVVGSYFTARFYDGALGYERYDYSWDWGHYFFDIVEAVDYWKKEVVG